MVSTLLSSVYQFLGEEIIEIASQNLTVGKGIPGGKESANTKSTNLFAVGTTDHFSCIAIKDRIEVHAEGDICWAFEPLCVIVLASLFSSVLRAETTAVGLRFPGISRVQTLITPLYFGCNWEWQHEEQVWRMGASGCSPVRTMWFRASCQASLCVMNSNCVAIFFGTGTHSKWLPRLTSRETLPQRRRVSIAKDGSSVRRSFRLTAPFCFLLHLQLLDHLLQLANIAPCKLPGLGKLRHHGLGTPSEETQDLIK